MPDGSYTMKDVIAAETAAVEARIAAQKLLNAGAWFAYAAAKELVQVRREKADRIRARIGRHAVAV